MEDPAAKTAREAQEAAARLAAIVESSEDAIVGTDLDGRITSWNAAAGRLFGYSAEEMVGERVLRIFPPELRGEEEWIRAQLVRGEPIAHRETVRMGRDGRRIGISLTVSPVRNPAGVLVGASRILRDISERQAAEAALRESEARFRAAFDQGAVGMALTTMEGRLLKVNPAFCRMLGVSEGELAGRHYEEITHPEDVAENRRGTEQLKRGELNSFRMEKRYLRNDGTVLWADMSTAVVRDSQGVGLYCVTHIQDVSGARQVREGLARSKEELERLVGERTAQLAEANANLQHFSYTAAHDLRAPLRGILSFAQILASRYAGQLDEKDRSVLERLRESAERMGRLLGDLLDYSRVGRSELRLETVKLEEAVQEALALLETDIQRKGAEISVAPELPAVLGHPATVVMVISNLVSNGLKFMPKGVKPQLRIWAEAAEKRSARLMGTAASPQAPTSNYVRLWVADNGIGIAPADQRLLFGEFRRLHPVASYAGTGLGLAIVRIGVQRMGGRVGVESEVGKGSRFWIELRAANAWALTRSD